MLCWLRRVILGRVILCAITILYEMVSIDPSYRLGWDYCGLNFGLDCGGPLSGSSERVMVVVSPQGPPPA
jgi:hypothetical protein